MMIRLSVPYFLLAILLLGSMPLAVAGPYPAHSDPAGQVQPDSIVAWASSVVDYSPAPGVVTDFSVATNALGAADGGVVSLGDLDNTQISSGVLPGTITLAVPTPIVNGNGPDFAVFENAGTFFGDIFVFAELGFVEVSSNGADFARFPATSLNTPAVPNPDFDDTMPEAFPDNTRFLAVPQVAETTSIDALFGRNFAGINTTNTDNLAGVHPSEIGTPFDLDDIAGDSAVLDGLVNLSDIRFVRVVDIPGNGAYLDSENRPILDTWLTTGSGGFDLDAVGVINTPEPSALTIVALLASAGLLARWRNAWHGQ